MNDLPVPLLPIFLSGNLSRLDLRLKLDFVVSCLRVVVTLKVH